MKQTISGLTESISLERISFLIYNKGIEPIIAHLDLEMVKTKLQDKGEGPGWTEEQCDDAEIEYKRFLQMNLKYPNRSIVPHKAMDIMWHQHILDTRAYQKDCISVFSKFFHHFPYFGIRDEQDRKNLNHAFDETQVIYRQEFGEDMLEKESGRCTRNCVSRCTRKCKT